MVGSWEAWHCSVRLSPKLMSALEGARVILVASAKRNKTLGGWERRQAQTGAAGQGRQFVLSPRKEEVVGPAEP